MRFEQIIPKRGSRLNCGDADLAAPLRIFSSYPRDWKLFHLVLALERDLAPGPQFAANTFQMRSPLTDVNGHDFLLQNAAVGVGGP